MTKNINRRGLLLKGMATLGALGASAAHAQSCLLTPVQPEGPFYPIESQEDTNFDLTQVKGKLIKARGEIVVLKGVVRDNSCKPIEGALVEIWQACDTGRYNHSSDPNTAALDPNFQYWGQYITNEKGEYHFKTIVPGAYPATNTWMRPPHIHMKIQLRGFEELITQVYFKEFKRLNSKDRILQRLSQAEKDNVIIDYKSVNGSVRTGTFDITLNAF